MAMRTKWTSLRGNWRRLVLGVGLGALAAAFCWGQAEALPRAGAVEPPSKAVEAAPSHSTDYATRPVANIYGDETLTREEFGEYLIAREQERLEHFINRRIIDRACREAGIEVTSGEIDAALQDDLTKLNVSREQFMTQILKHYHKTLYEWKEDVVRPRLQMTRLVKGQVTIEAKDLQDAYDSYYGEKVDCKIIMWKKSEAQMVERNLYSKIRDSEEEFNRTARAQESATLAAHEGRLDQPVARHSTGNPEFEKVVFALQPAEVSRIIDTPDGIVVVKCIKHIPPDTSVTLESVREKLTREIMDKKIQLQIPVAFKAMREKANVQSFLDSQAAQEETLRRLNKEAISAISPGLARPGQ